MVTGSIYMIRIRNAGMFTMFALLSAMLLREAAAGIPPSVWDPEGSGSWADRTRWKDGNVPQAGSQVRASPNVPIYANDDDANILAVIKEVVLEGSGSRLVVTNEYDLMLPFQIWGEGALEKFGGGTLQYDVGSVSERPYCYGGCVVREGCLRFLSSAGREQKLNGPLAVYGNGVIELNKENSTTTSGILGDGTFSCDSERPRDLNIINEDASGAYDFSGKLVGDIQVVLLGGRQLLSCYANENERPARIKGGILCAASFGAGNNTPSSWGKKELVFVGTENSDVRCAAEYIGGGEVTQRPVYVNENSRHVALGGGPRGGLALQGTLTVTVQRMTTMEFFGDHVSPCVFDGNWTVPQGYGVYTLKTGTGTWRFAAADGRSSRQNRGVVATERGTLEYETITEAGTECSLGDATMLYEPDAGEKVDYAYLVGNGDSAPDTASATMRYVGSGDARITTRPVAVRGTANFESTSGDLLWSGFFNALAQPGRLVYGGTADNCFAESISDAGGALSLGKSGAGTWTLGGSLTFSGGVSVYGGTLRIQKSDVFSWYRLTIKKLSGASRQEVMLSRIALYSGSDVDQAAGLRYDPACDGDFRSLSPGCVCLGSSGQSVDPSHPLGDMFGVYQKNKNGRWGREPRKALSLEDPDSWLSVVMRLPKGAQEIVRYDMVSGWMAAGGPFEATPSDWVLEGSTDGVTWHKIEEVHTGHNIFSGTDNYWLSDAKAATLSDNAGFTVASRRTGVNAISSLPSLAVAGGAKFGCDEPLVVHALECDAAKGSGAVEGVEFARTGQLRVSGTLTSGLAVVTHSDCFSVENVANWAVVHDGKVRSGWRARAGAGQITLVPAGMRIVVR
jgi:autotransporter-associated beta strand protein